MADAASTERESALPVEVTQPSDLALRQIGLTQVALIQAYLHGARHVLDLWRTAIREQQDRTLAEWHARLWGPASTGAFASTPAESEPKRMRSSNSKKTPETPKDVIKSKRRPSVDHTEALLLSREH